MVISLGPDLPLGTSTPPAEDRGPACFLLGTHLTTRGPADRRGFCLHSLGGEMKFSSARLSITGRRLQLFHELLLGFNSRPYKLSVNSRRPPSPYETHMPHKQHAKKHRCTPWRLLTASTKTDICVQKVFAARAPKHIRPPIVRSRWLMFFSHSRHGQPCRLLAGITRTINSPHIQHRHHHLGCLGGIWGCHISSMRIMSNYGLMNEGEVYTTERIRAN